MKERGDLCKKKRIGLWPSATSLEWMHHPKKQKLQANDTNNSARKKKKGCGGDGVDKRKVRLSLNVPLIRNNPMQTPPKKKCQKPNRKGGMPPSFLVNKRERNQWGKHQPKKKGAEGKLLETEQSTRKQRQEGKDVPGIYSPANLLVAWARASCKKDWASLLQMGLA